MNANRRAFRLLLFLGISLLARGVPNTEATDWPMLGRDETRNSVSPEMDPPIEWDIGNFDPKTGRWTPGPTKNTKWVAKLGSITCGDPVVTDT